MSSGPEFGLAAMHRIMKKSGAERVSRQAVELSIHAGRKTIKPEDIRLASKNVIKA